MKQMTTRQGTGVRNALQLIYKFAKARKAYITVLSCFVVFVATYLLILPAMTLDQDEAARQGGIDVPVQVEETELAETEQLDQDAKAIEPGQAQKDKRLSYEGKGFEITAEGADLPEDTEIIAREIQEKDRDYDALYQDALEAVKTDADAFAFAKFYDISLMSEGEVIEPENPMDVTISYDKVLKANDAEHVRIVHFAVDEETGETKAEVLDPELVDTQLKSGNLKGTSFKAESFSVYAVVYTVDFHWEVDGEAYDFSLPGGGFVSLEELAETLHIVGSSQEAKQFVEEVENAECSAPELVWVGKAEQDTTVGDLKDANELECQYSADLTEEDIDEINAKSIEAGDWALISLQSFTSEEHLTVTLKDGQEFIIRLTDPVTDTAPDQMQPLDTADTRSQGVKMWLFDYDLDHSLDNQDNKANTTNNKTDGINNESDLKFLGWGAGNSDGGSGINDFTGLDNGNGDNQIRAIQGIVLNDLDDKGYPVLNTNESLEYLFNPEAQTDDRRVYGGNKSEGNVNKLFELKDGYYIYDSDEHYAELQNDGTNFNVYTSTMAQTNKEGGLHNPPRAVGFFPFDTYEHVYNDLKYENDWNHYGNNGTLYLNPNGDNGPSGLNHHLGVAMEMDFSIPKNGTMDGTAGGAPIQFNFSGDDDMWVFIDGHLVLDIGGLHQPVDGTINFQNGIATIVGKATTNSSSDNTGTNAIVTATGAQNPRGNDFDFYSALGITPGDGKTHTMKVFYMERGGCDSNCMISFNLPLTKGKAGVKVAKCEKDATPTKPLQGVKFGLYSDAACTELMQEVATDASGNLEFKDLAIMEEGQKYYMKETKALAGYQMDETIYTLEAQNNNGDYTFKVLKNGQEIETIGQSPALPVIYNEPLAPIELTVEKKWQDQSGHEVDPPGNASAKFKVERYFRYEGDVETPCQPCTFKVYRYKENNTPVKVGSDYTLLGGSQVTVNWGYSNGYYNNNYSGIMQYKEKTGEQYQNKPSLNAPVILTLPAGGEAAIYIRDENVGTNWGAGVVNITVDGTPFNNQTEAEHVSTDWAKDTDYNGPEIVLPNDKISEDHPWTGKFTGLKTCEDKNGISYYYKYYITETAKDPSSSTCVYVDGDGQVVSDPSTLQTDQDGTQTVINKVPNGSLKLRKWVTIAGVSPNDVSDQKSKADGEYTFTVAGIPETPTAGIRKTVKIKIENGKAAKAWIDDTEVSFDNNNDLFVEVPDLTPGDYTITEEPTSIDDVWLSSITGGKNDGDIEARTITVSVAADKSGNDVETAGKATFTNNYRPDSEEDIAHISIKKTFEGLPAGTVLDNDFKITIQVAGKTYELTSNPTDPAVTFDGSHFPVCSWTVSVKGLLKDSPVTVKEVNAGYPAYDVTTSINGSSNTTTYTGTVSPSTIIQAFVPHIYPQNNKLDFNVTDTKIFMALLTDGHVLVISKNRLSLSERAAVEGLLADTIQPGMSQGNWKKELPPYYYVADENRPFHFKGATITYNNDTVHFDKKCQWTHTAEVAITYHPGSPADFNFVNSYTEKSVGMEILKVDAGDMRTPLKGAGFVIHRIDPATARYTDAPAIYPATSGDDHKTGADGKASFNGLTEGYYEVKEESLPAGYIQTGDGVFYIRVHNGVVSLIEKDSSAETGWKEKSSGGKLLFTAAEGETPALATVGNESGAALPSSGGPGTTWIYLLGSLLLIGSGILLAARRRTAH